MTRCVVYDAIRRHRPDLLQECADLISADSVPDMAAFIFRNGWGSTKLSNIVNLHTRIVQFYGNVRDLPHAKQQQIRRYLLPLLDEVGKETVALIEESVQNK